MNILGSKIFPVVLCMLLLGGCWDTKDINKEYLPVVMGIGKGRTEKYRIILQVPSPKGRTQFLDKEAGSISKAIDLIRTDSEKSINLVHLRLLLFDQELAREGIHDLIDFAVRANDISIKGMIAVVDGNFVQTLYHVISPTPELSSYDFFSEEAGWTPNQSIVRIWEAYRSQNSYSEDMAIPMLKSGKRTLYTFQGTAIMLEDRMVGKLNQEETLLYNLFKGKYSGGTIEVAENTSVLIQKAKIKHHCRWTNEGPLLLTNVSIDVVVSESPRGKSKQQIEKEIKQLLERNFNKTADKIQSFHSDVLGTGLIFRPRLSYANIKEWRSKWYPKLEQKINVRVNVQNEIYLKEEAGVKKSRIR